MKHNIDITVAIVTYNRSKYIKRALESMINQDVEFGINYEIVVVDDGSTDDTRDVVSEIKKKSNIPINYIYQNGKGVASARNESVRKARGEWIAFFDDDQIAEPNYLKELYRISRKYNADCVGGTRLLLFAQKQKNTSHPVIRALLGEIIYLGEYEIPTWKWFPSTGNSFVKKSAIKKVGTFNDSLLMGGEDLDFFRRFRKKGFRTWQAPKAITHHIIPKFRLSSEYLLRTAQRSGANHAYMIYKEIGIIKSIFILVGYLGRAVIIALPKLFLAKIKRKKDFVIGEKCQVFITYSYLRKFLDLIFPNLFKQENYFSKLAFRMEKDREKNAREKK